MEERFVEFFKYSRKYSKAEAAEKAGLTVKDICELWEKDLETRIISQALAAKLMEIEAELRKLKGKTVTEEEIDQLIHSICNAVEIRLIPPENKP
jgi:hypothetical protein